MAATQPTTTIPAFERVQGQAQVRSFLETAVREGKVSHAYLFVGPAGCGQEEMARALAKCLVCPKDGCNACEECIRVDRGSHPDVRWLKPEGAAGYVVEQVRNLIQEVPLSPVRGAAKVYILESAETLSATCANALLKTIEEPPEGVAFILMARSLDAVLPTVSSRCQCVPFRVADQQEAVRQIALSCGIADEEVLSIALALTGTPERAVGFVRSVKRQNARRAVVRVLGDLPRADAWDVLCSVDTILEAYEIKKKKTKKAAEELTPEQAHQKELEAEFLSAKAQKILEQRAKRETTAAERSAIVECVAVVQSILRDVLMRVSGAGSTLVNTDSLDVIERLAATADTAGVLRALEACGRATADLGHNVSMQLILEVMLLNCKEALCPPLSR